MPDVTAILTARLRDAVAKAVGAEHSDADPLIKPTANPKFGDYQANLAMGLAKQVGQKPRDLAQKIVEHADLSDLCDAVDIAGPGFINLTLSSAFLDKQVQAMASDDRLGVPAADPPQNVVIDYSSPNVAKEMHVGHLRSTIIGDAISRVLQFQGHHVIRQNHLGDWGTQFGMLIEHLFDIGYLSAADRSIGDLNELYQQAKRKFDEDEAFAKRARERVVKLQAREPQTIDLWMTLIDESLRHFNAVYRRLNVKLTDDDVRPESFYNDKLAGVVTDLEKQGVIRESQSAMAAFPHGFTDKEGEPRAFLVRKADGGYLYATTDLAAARYRIEELKADRVIYLADMRQSDHFAMLFQTLRDAGWAPPGVSMAHVSFGTVLGADGKPFKTRAGGTVRLIDLLDEAEQRAAKIVAEKAGDLAEEQRATVAHAVGIGALKYADLSNDRVKDYKFDWERMLSFEGNTAPYLQNAYVRIRSIFRKSGREDVGVNAPITVREPEEKALALMLFQFAAAVEAVGSSLEPHRMCTYLYELAAAFHKFYENCSVLNAADDATRESRLALCGLVARTLERGLDLLGIEVVERM